MTPTTVVMSWSGGKDSAMALEALRRDPSVHVVALLTSVTSGYDRISIHGVRRALLEAQGHALNLPIIEVELAPVSSNEAYEAAFLTAVARARRQFPTIEAIAFGDLYLEDVRAYRERLVAQTGLICRFPIWGIPTNQLARQCLDDGVCATLVCVDTTQLGGRFVGRSYDQALLDELPAAVDPCGEGGEFHTFVSYARGFRTPIAIAHGETVLRDARFAYLDLLPATP